LARRCAGDTIPIADSRIDPDFRPDEVPVTWRDDESVVRRGAASVLQGAEGEVSFEGDPPETVRKRRLPKSYRHPDLDARLRRERTRAEARLLRDARRAGVPTPLVRDVDLAETTLTVAFVGDDDLRDLLGDGERSERATRAVRDVGRHLATLHEAGLVHGDPTTRNVRVGPDRTHLIDFGLGYHAEDVEAHAMDLHVCCGSLDGTADDADRLRAAVCEAYATAGDERVVEHLAEVEGRGRYQ